MATMATLTDLPTELVFEIHLLSCSSALPCLNRYYRSIFQSASTLYRIAYLKRKVKTTNADKVLERILRFPLCTLDIFNNIFKDLREKNAESATIRSFALPRRLFKYLSPHKKPDFTYIKSLLEAGADVNSHQGCAVYCAVSSRNMDLLELLYTKTIDPNQNGGIALGTAVKQNNKDMVNYILEASRDRTKMNLPIHEKIKTQTLRLAAEKGKWETFDLLIKDGAVPDIKTLQLMPEG